MVYADGGCGQNKGSVFSHNTSKNMKLGGGAADKLAALDSRCLLVLHMIMPEEREREGRGEGVINITMRCIIINIIHNDLDVL